MFGDGERRTADGGNGWLFHVFQRVVSTCFTPILKGSDVQLELRMMVSHDSTILKSENHVLIQMIRTLVICLNFGIPMGPHWRPNGLMSIPGIDRGLTPCRFSRLHAGRSSVLAERFRGRRKLRGKTHGKTHGKSPINHLLILLVDDI